MKEKLAKIQPPQEEILEEIRALTKENHEILKKVKRFVVFSEIMGFIKLALIVVPIILGFIFLPPFLKEIFSQYGNLLGISPENINADTLKNLINTSPTLNQNINY